MSNTYCSPIACECFLYLDITGLLGDDNLCTKTVSSSDEITIQVQEIFISDEVTIMFPLVPHEVSQYKSNDRHLKLHMVPQRLNNRSIQMPWKRKEYW